MKNVDVMATSDRQVYLSAPMKTSDYITKEFIETKRKQVSSALVKLKNNSNQKHSKDTMSVLGVSYKVHSCTGPKPMCQIDGENIIITFPDSYSCCKKETFIKEWYRSILKSTIPDILKKWQDATGMRCSEWQTKQMRTKWGSCNTETKKIWLSVRLAQKSPWCIELVVLHELAHTVVPNHGPEFKAILNKYMPDWKERNKILNSNITPE